MTDYQMFAFVAVLVIIGAVTLVATKEWLRPGGRAGAILYSMAGCSVAALLFTADIPPDWFDGGSEGFMIGVSLLLWAFVLRTRSERAFGRPLFLGMGLTLLILNLYAHF